jgi:type IV pilus assembly protein PilW
VAIMFNGLMEIYLSSRQTYNATDNLTRLQENGRTTVDILVAGLRRSGYLGGNSDPSSIAGSLGQVTGAASCVDANDSSWSHMIDQPIFGLDDTAAGYDCIDNYLQGDVLTMRYASPWVVATADFVGTKIYLRSSLFEGKIFKGADTASNLNVVFDNPQRQHELLAYSYYVADTGRDCAGVDVPGLFRKALDVNNKPTTEELIAGIENLQFQYNVGDQYVDADTVEAGGDWDNVISVKLWVLVRAECPETGYTDARTYVLGDVANYVPADSYRRSLFSTVVALRN